MTVPNRSTDVVDGVVQPRETRTSLTFRSIRSGPCGCPYRETCDHPELAAGGNEAGPRFRALATGLFSLETKLYKAGFTHRDYPTLTAKEVPGFPDWKRLRKYAQMLVRHSDEGFRAVHALLETEGGAPDEWGLRWDA